MSLNSLSKKYIKEDLFYFKTQKNGLMPLIAKKLIKEDIKNIVKIYGKMI